MEEQEAEAVATPSTSAATTSGSAIKKKHEEKFRKKDQKSWENVSKAIATIPPEDKISYIEKKYQSLYDEYRLLSQNNQQLSKQFTSVQKDRDYNQAELAKSIVARARLENLCRELQKQNKQIKEENIAKIKEEEERRKEVSLKFADKLSDINTMMDENKEKSDKLREENLKMTTKLAELYTQFQKREEDIAKMSNQLELERQYSQATLAKMELEIKAEKEIHAKEQAMLKNSLEKSEANCCVLLETVKGLQDHIDVYKNQYEDFESTMSKSAKVFDSFKFEIANMTKQVATLEQEAQSWKNKFHDSMKALVEMTEVKKNQDLYLQSLEKKNDQLQKLCRQLQTDRTNFLKLLKSNGIEPVTSPSVKEKSSDEKKESPKMTKKEKELQLLKENLKAVQDELSRLNIEETNKDEGKKTDNEASQNAAEEQNAKDLQPVPKVLESNTREHAIDDEVQPVPKVLEPVKFESDDTNRYAVDQEFVEIPLTADTGEPIQD